MLLLPVIMQLLSAAVLPQYALSLLAQMHDLSRWGKWGYHS